MKNLVLLLCLLLSVLAAAPPASAADTNGVLLTGDVARVDLMYFNGAYLETLVWVWSYAGGIPAQPILFRCNGAAGGSLANCLYPTAFFSCPTTHQTWTDIYEPTLVTHSYTCTAPARRDAGACVEVTARIRPLDQFAYSIFADGHAKTIQAISLDVMHLSYVNTCSVKM